MGFRFPDAAAGDIFALYVVFALPEKHHQHVMSGDIFQSACTLFQSVISSITSVLFLQAAYHPCVVRTEAPSERSDNSGEGVGRLPRRQDDEHGEDGLQRLVVYSL